MTVWEIILTSILSGGVIVGGIQAAEHIVLWNKNRKAAKEDRAEQKKDEDTAKKDAETKQALEDIQKNNAVQNEALKYILYDRIRYLALCYIRDGEVDFDDRRILRDMHTVYHYGLNANGDLDDLMDAVGELPLKQK